MIELKLFNDLDTCEAQWRTFESNSNFTFFQSFNYIKNLINIENNQTKPVDSGEKKYNDPVHEQIYKVSKAILNKLGIEFDKISDIIISHTSRIITKYL